VADDHPLDNQVLEGMAIRLESMLPRTKAPADGLGKYLGDGMPHPGADLRTVPMAAALRQLLAIRSAVTEYRECVGRGESQDLAQRMALAAIASVLGLPLRSAAVANDESYSGESWVAATGPWKAYPVGTRARESWTGCHWTKTERGWQAPGGATFVRPGTADQVLLLLSGEASDKSGEQGTTATAREPMSDEWLSKAFSRAMFIGRHGYAPEHETAAVLRGFANRVLLSYAATAEQALGIDFTGRGAIAASQPESELAKADGERPSHED
jgi:hypothetical protein